MKNKTMMQYFEWYLPDDGLLWKRCVQQAENLKKAGFNMLWLPPAYKGAAGSKSTGYDVYDTYDLGEFEQKGSIATKYGTRDDYLKAVKALKEQGIQVLTDIVLNHMMGADKTEQVMAVENAWNNRNAQIAERKSIQAWTKFDFPVRNGKYSGFTWNAKHFSGTDWDDAAKRSGIFLFEGKNWNHETDGENANYDYLMGVDLDTDEPETVKALHDWGKWYIDTVGMDGLRLDAVKHISFDFYREWLSAMREYAGKELFAVGEYWSPDLGKLTHYLDVTNNSLSLFDVPLHFALHRASDCGGQCDMGAIFENTLVKVRPQNAVTFVDNHDTQPGQALASFVLPWFKPIAYALILLKKDGIPCVFYGDYYGILHDGIAPVPDLKKLVKLRECYAYGEEMDYFDDSSVVGFTRMGDKEHSDSGMAVLVTDTSGGKKRMKVGEHFAGQAFYDALGHISGQVIIGQDGIGEFAVKDGSVSVWVTKEAYEMIRTVVE